MSNPVEEAIDCVRLSRPAILAGSGSQPIFDVGSGDPIDAVGDRVINGMHLMSETHKHCIAVS